MKLKILRKSKDFTLDDVAEITGISRSTLWRIENNPTYKISLRDALVILNYFPQLSLEDLNNGKTPAYPPVQKVPNAAKA